MQSFNTRGREKSIPVTFFNPEVEDVKILFAKVQRLGRMTSKTTAEANQIVSKVIHDDPTLTIRRVARTLHFS